MPTIHRQDGFCFLAYNHEPPHVHAFEGGTEAKLGLGDETTAPFVIDPKGMAIADVRRAVRIVEDIRALCWKRGGSTMSKWKSLTDAELDAQIEAARRQATEREQLEPRGVAARYDLETDRIIVDLKSGVTVMVPRDRLPELSRASNEAVAEVSVSPSGEGLHWDSLDVHVSIPGLMLELAGPRIINETVARRAGRASSDAKAWAARENGKKGGRPKKAAP